MYIHYLGDGPVLYLVVPQQSSEDPTTDDDVLSQPTIDPSLLKHGCDFLELLKQSTECASDSKK